MKKILDNYTFSKGAADAGTVTLTDLASTGIEPERLLLITDVTQGRIIYNFADPTKRYFAVTGNVVTLHYDTSALSNTDKLQIIYEADQSDPLFNTTAGEYNVTPFYLSDGQKKNLQLDSAGNLKSYLATQLDPINDKVTTYPLGHTCASISTATTSNLKSGSGVLSKIVVTGGVAGTITIYDNTAASGTIIAAFDSTNALANYEFNALFTSGLTIVTSAATKLTVMWR